MAWIGKIVHPGSRSFHIVGDPDQQPWQDLSGTFVTGLFRGTKQWRPWRAPLSHRLAPCDRLPAHHV